MAAKSRSDIIADIEDCISRNGGAFSDWYVGCTGAPKQMLFTQHKVRQSGDAWISRLAKDEYQAGEVVDYFRTTRKTKAGPRATKESDLYVYAFKIRSHTRI